MYPRMTSESGGMGPVDYCGAGWRGDEPAVWGACTRVRVHNKPLTDLVVDGPGQTSYYVSRGGDPSSLGGFLFGGKLSRQDVRLDISGTWATGNGEVESSKKHKTCQRAWQEFNLLAV